MLNQRSFRDASGLSGLYRTAFVSLVFMVAAAAAGLAANQRPVDAGEDEESSQSTPQQTARVSLALASLDERSRVVSGMLLESARTYRKIAVERSAAQQELLEALERMDREAIRVRDLTRDRLDTLTQDVQRARLRLNQLLEQSDRKLQEIAFLIQERDQVARRIAELRATAPQAQEILTGTWELSWLPNGVSGTMYLEQQGTLVTGQYKLGALGTGSLQGTFVGGKLYLQRIDSQRGRDAELEGVLDADGSRIRGTWQNYEMVQGGTPRGQWVAKRAGK